MSNVHHKMNVDTSWQNHANNKPYNYSIKIGRNAEPKNNTSNNTPKTTAGISASNNTEAADTFPDTYGSNSLHDLAGANTSEKGIPDGFKNALDANRFGNEARNESRFPRLSAIGAFFARVRTELGNFLWNHIGQHPYNLGKYVRSFFSKDENIEVEQLLNNMEFVKSPGSDDPNFQLPDHANLDMDRTQSVIEGENPEFKQIREQFGIITPDLELYKGRNGEAMSLRSEAHHLLTTRMKARDPVTSTKTISNQAEKTSTETNIDELI